VTKRILVLGGNGYIGRRVVAALAQSPWATPVAASRRFSPSTIAEGVEHIRLDATDRAALRAALKGIHGVVNCIAGDANSIVSSAGVLFEEAASRDPTLRIVHLSSMAVYGAATGFLEESAALSDSPTPYVRAKVAAERLATVFGDTVILRPGIVYGADSPQWTDRIARWLQARRIGDLGPRGDGYCNLLYIDDLVAAILQSLQLPGAAGGTFNLAAPSPPTWNEYFIAFALALAAPPVRRMTQRRLMIETKLLAPPLKIAELLGARLGIRSGSTPPAMPPSLLQLFRQDLRLDVRRAEELLGQRWTPFEQGLRQAADWYRADSASLALE
jgi:nucleoside-diphosphate-sugar epimerase